MIKIKDREGEVLYVVDKPTIKDAVQGLNKEGSSLKMADLSNADLSGANLYNPDLIDADLSNTDLGDANLWSAMLNRANLIGANLDGADLSHADLVEVDLSLADLRGADLSGADLSEANLEKAQLHWESLPKAKNIPEELLKDYVFDIVGKNIKDRYGVSANVLYLTYFKTSLNKGRGIRYVYEVKLLRDDTFEKITLTEKDLEEMYSGGGSLVDGWELASNTKSKPKQESKPNKPKDREMVQTLDDFIASVGKTLRSGEPNRMENILEYTKEMEVPFIAEFGEEAFDKIFEIVSDLKEADKNTKFKKPKRKKGEKKSVVTKKNEKVKKQEIEKELDLDKTFESVEIDEKEIEDINLDELFG